MCDSFDGTWSIYLIFCASWQKDDNDALDIQFVNMLLSYDNKSNFINDAGSPSL